MPQTSAIHISASATHYDKESSHYDTFNEENSLSTNQLIEHILQKYKVKTVLDLTCGTGSQVFYLVKHGYEVTGVDINNKMLAIAERKARGQFVNVDFVLGDVRTTQCGNYDAVITVFNAIGHLTKSDFVKALTNISTNLNEGGLYIFDIFNLDFLLEKDNITKLTMDIQKQDGDVLAREIQYSTINEAGVLTSYDIYHQQKVSMEPVISTAFQTLQTYTANQLKRLLEENSFEVLDICSMDGTKFIETETERLLVVAKKNKV